MDTKFYTKIIQKITKRFNNTMKQLGLIEIQKLETESNEASDEGTAFYLIVQIIFNFLIKNQKPVGIKVFHVCNFSFDFFNKNLFLFLRTAIKYLKYISLEVKLQ